MPEILHQVLTNYLESDIIMCVFPRFLHVYSTSTPPLLQVFSTTSSPPPQLFNSHLLHSCLKVAETVWTEGLLIEHFPPESYTIRYNLLIYQARESSLVSAGFLIAQFLQKT